MRPRAAYPAARHVLSGILLVIPGVTAPSPLPAPPPHPPPRTAHARAHHPPPQPTVGGAGGAAPAAAAGCCNDRVRAEERRAKVKERRGPPPPCAASRGVFSILASFDTTTTVGSGCTTDTAAGCAICCCMLQHAGLLLLRMLLRTARGTVHALPSEATYRGDRGGDRGRSLPMRRKLSAKTRTSLPADLILPHCTHSGPASDSRRPGAAHAGRRSGAPTRKDSGSLLGLSITGLK